MMLHAHILILVKMTIFPWRPAELILRSGAVPQPSRGGLRRRCAPPFRYARLLLPRLSISEMQRLTLELKPCHQQDPCSASGSAPFLHRAFLFCWTSTPCLTPD